MLSNKKIKEKRTQLFSSNFYRSFQKKIRHYLQKRALKNSDKTVKDIMPYKNWGLPECITDIIMEYAIDAPLLKPCFFSGKDHALFKTLFLAKHAGPLDQFEFYARSHIAKELDKKSRYNIFIDKIFMMNGMQGTLIQLLVSRLDVSLAYRTNQEMKTIKGMTEIFLKIIADLLPGRLIEVEKQIKLASPLENKVEKHQRRTKNLAAICQVFSAFEQDDKNITQEAIATFKQFVKNKKSLFSNDQGYLTDNRFPLDLLHLMYVAFEVLAVRGENLLSGHWYSKKAGRFCIEIIGATLQHDLPPRIRQMLRAGLCYVFTNFRIGATRIIDVEGKAFRGAGSQYLLGINSYYDDIRLGDSVWGRAHESWLGGTAQRFLTLIMNYDSDGQKVLVNHESVNALIERDPHPLLRVAF